MYFSSLRQNATSSSHLILLDLISLTIV